MDRAWLDYRRRAQEVKGLGTSSVRFLRHPPPSHYSAIPFFFLSWRNDETLCVRQRRAQHSGRTGFKCRSSLPNSIVNLKSMILECPTLCKLGPLATQTEPARVGTHPELLLRHPRRTPNLRPVATGCQRVHRVVEGGKTEFRRAAEYLEPKWQFNRAV